VDSLPFKPLQSGVVYDSPPLWLRLIMGSACLAGGIVMLIFAISQGLGVPVIVICGALLIALYLLWTLPTSANLAMVTTGFWTLLGVILLTGQL
jgi:hypothetical protein